MPVIFHRKPDPELQMWCQKKLAELDDLKRILDAIPDHHTSNRKAHRMPTAKPAVSVLPDIHAHKNRARFFVEPTKQERRKRDLRHAKALADYNRLTPAERLARAKELEKKI